MNDPNGKAPYEFEAYAVGFACASVCSSLTLEETTRRLNFEHSVGPDLVWFPSEDAYFRDGNPNPCSCENYPETHKHYLFEC